MWDQFSYSLRDTGWEDRGAVGWGVCELVGAWGHSQPVSPPHFLPCSLCTAKVSLNSGSSYLYLPEGARIKIANDHT